MKKSSNSTCADKTKDTEPLTNFFYPRAVYNVSQDALKVLFGSQNQDESSLTKLSEAAQAKLDSVSSLFNDILLPSKSLSAIRDDQSSLSDFLNDLESQFQEFHEKVARENEELKSELASKDETIADLTEKLANITRTNSDSSLRKGAFEANESFSSSKENFSPKSKMRRSIFRSFRKKKSNSINYSSALSS